MNKLQTPNFFIVGAPKSGTTALSEYLREHKEVFMSTPKEPHYFATDLDGYRAMKTKNEYLDLFIETTSSHIAIGEASVYYLYSKEAIKNIYDFDKDAKIIVMLRNPVEMVYSLHSQLLYSANENIIDFKTAWSEIKNRKNGKNLPKYSKDHKILFYDEVAKYSKQLENILEYFPKNQVKIILFDAFKENTKGVYQEVLEFLNLNADNRIEFPRVNENSMPRNPYLNNLIKKQPFLIRNIKDILKKIFGIKQFGLVKKLSNFNTKKVKRKELSDEMKKIVYDNYKDDIFKLSKILNKNLDIWNLKYK